MQDHLFGIDDIKPLIDYIYYNKCGLVFEGLECTASEISKNRHFRRLHSHLMPLSSEPPQISA